jgi:hypothetical protein
MSCVELHTDDDHYHQLAMFCVEPQTDELQLAIFSVTGLQPVNDK